MNDMEPFSQPDELVVLEAERKRREHPPVRTGVGAEYLEARGAFKHLVQVKRARRRMTVFFVPVVAAFIFSIIACASLLQSTVVVTIPQSSRAHFLGWNVLYNTQGFGPFFSVAGAARLTAAFYVQLLWSALLIGNRFFRMRTRDRYDRVERGRTQEPGWAVGDVHGTSRTPPPSGCAGTSASAGRPTT